MMREKSPKLSARNPINKIQSETPKPITAPTTPASPPRSPKSPRLGAPKIKLPQLSLDVPDGVGSVPRSKSVGSRPSKPLPALLVTSRDIPNVTVDDNNNNIVQVETSNVESSTKGIPLKIDVPSNTIDGKAETVAIQIQYSFIKTVRLPRSFSIDQLQDAARDMVIPKHLEFRYLTIFSN